MHDVSGGELRALVRQFWDMPFTDAWDEFAEEIVRRVVAMGGVKP